jgi:putative ABC transport system permease protein
MIGGAVRQPRPLEPTVTGWLVQAPSTISPAQVKSAQLMAAAQGMFVESRDNVPTMSSLINAATALGIGLALAILAISVGLVRSETAGDLRILAATGASSRARRALSAATAGGLALLGAVLGTVAGYVGVIGFLRGGSFTGGACPPSPPLRRARGSPWRLSRCHP